MKHSRPIVLFALVLASCYTPQPSVYLPTSPVMSYLSHKGEFRVTAGSNLSTNQSSESDTYTSLDAAYAITEDRAIIGSMAVSSPGSDSNGVSYQYGELGIGYYKKFDAYGHFELYGGSGYGHIRAAVQQGAYWYASNGSTFGIITRRDASLVRPFLQANIAAEGEVAAFGLSLRASYLSIHRLRTDSSWYEYVIDTTTKTANSTPAHTTHYQQYDGLFLEPAWTFMIGFDRVKFVSKEWWSIPIGHDPPFLWANFNLSFGVTVDIGPHEDK